jgi:hypothetical protein
MNKYIITFREKVFDGRAWLGCMRVDSVFWNTLNGEYQAAVGNMTVVVPKSNVRAIVEVKEEGQS